MLRHLKKQGKCMLCGRAATTQWANIDHVYCLEPTEWLELCVRCHNEFDVLMNGKVDGRPPKRVLSYAWWPKPVGQRVL